jgi:hypothetical protein
VTLREITDTVLDRRHNREEAHHTSAFTGSIPVPPRTTIDLFSDSF